MIEDHIDDGDYVVIRKQETAENGERVVAMIDNEVTLKRFYREKDAGPPGAGQRHHAADRRRRSKDATQILGVLVGVLRKC